MREKQEKGGEKEREDIYTNLGHDEQVATSWIAVASQTQCLVQRNTQNPVCACVCVCGRGGGGVSYCVVLSTQRSVTLLSPTHSVEPDESNARQRAAPAVLLLPPFTAFPVDTLNTFTCALLLPSWREMLRRRQTCVSMQNKKHYVNNKSRLGYNENIIVVGVKVTAEGACVAPI